MEFDKAIIKRSIASNHEKLCVLSKKSSERLRAIN